MKTYILKKCLNCNETLTNGNKRFCSIKCNNDYKIKNEKYDYEYIVTISNNFKSFTEISEFLKINRNTFNRLCNRLGCLSEVKKNINKNHKIKSLIKPNKNDLINIFKKLKSFTKVGEYYGVTDNSVRKWCKNFNLPNKSAELKKLLDIK